MAKAAASLKDKTVTVFNGVKSGVSGAISTLKGKAIDFANSLKDGVKSAVDRIWSGLSSSVKKIQEAQVRVETLFREGASRLKTAVKSGLNNVKATFNSAKKAAKSAYDATLRAAKLPYDLAVKTAKAVKAAWPKVRRGIIIGLAVTIAIPGLPILHRATDAVHMTQDIINAIRGGEKVERAVSSDVGENLDESAWMAGDVYAWFDGKKAEGYPEQAGEPQEGVWQRDKLTKLSESTTVGVYKRINPTTGKVEYSVVCKGTTPSRMGEWEENIDRFLMNTDDMKKVVVYAKYLVKKYEGADITFIGHSKGGAEAQAMALATDRNAVVFNTAPLLPNLQGLGKENANYTGRIDSFVVENEALNNTFDLLSDPKGYAIHYMPSGVNQGIANSPIYGDFYVAGKEHTMVETKKAVEAWQEREGYRQR